MYNLLFNWFSWFIYLLRPSLDFKETLYKYYITVKDEYKNEYLILLNKKNFIYWDKVYAKDIILDNKEYDVTEKIKKYAGPNKDFFCLDIDINDIDENWIYLKFTKIIIENKIEIEKIVYETKNIIKLYY